MVGALKVTLGVAPSGVTPRAYAGVLTQLTYSLEELDRLAEPDRRARASWLVSNTSWTSQQGPVIELRPDVRGADRTTEQLMRPGRALVSGVAHLRTQPEIPPAFTERIVDRISTVSHLIANRSSGLETVTLDSVGEAPQRAAIDEQVSENAEKAVAPASLAYGSVVGTLDVISARARQIKVGLHADFGPPITCNVHALPREQYLDAFDQRVLVSGLIKRNGRGQIVRIDADHLERLPDREPIAVDALRGMFKTTGPVSIAGYIEEQRGR